MNELQEMGCPECGGVAGFWASIEVCHPTGPSAFTRVWRPCNCKSRETSPKEQADTEAALDSIFQDIDDCYHALWLQWEALPEGYDFQI